MTRLSHLQDLADPGLCPRLVIKVGSALLVGPSGPKRAWLAALVQEIAAAHARGQQVIVVSSGAIALGARRLGLERAGAAAWPMRRPRPPWGRSRCRACGPNCWARMG
jgi:glutamate 5-kinase